MPSALCPVVNRQKTTQRKLFTPICLFRVSTLLLAHCTIKVVRVNPHAGQGKSKKTGSRIPIWRPSVFQTEGSFITAVDWDISSKCLMLIDFHLLKWVQSPNLNPEVDFRLCAAILKNRYDVITLPPFVRLLRNLAGRCKMTCRWLHIDNIRNRKLNSNMAAVRFLKREVVLS